MSEQNGQTPSQPSNNPGGFTLDYVKELRDEAASWRTKFREQEQKTTNLQAEVEKIIKTTSIGSELSKRNLNVDPSWIKIEEGQEVSKAVDNFLEKYPQFKSEQASNTNPQPTSIPGVKPIVPDRKNTNVPKFANSDYESVKKDPIARAKLRDHYRSLLTDGSPNRI